MPNDEQFWYHLGPPLMYIYIYRTHQLSVPDIEDKSLNHLIEKKSVYGANSPSLPTCTGCMQASFSKTMNSKTYKSAFCLLNDEQFRFFLGLPLDVHYIFNDKPVERPWYRRQKSSIIILRKNSVFGSSSHSMPTCNNASFSKTMNKPRKVHSKKKTFNAFWCLILVCWTMSNSDTVSGRHLTSNI